MTGPGPHVRLRFYTGGRLTDETWIDCREPGWRAQSRDVLYRHQFFTALAHAYGVPWYAESYDPAEPPGRAYQRTGTDPNAGASSCNCCVGDPERRPWKPWGGRRDGGQP